jgi:hypothetical protein|tara:strand:+ start:4290 stop:4877 length:588 start_codon:yes stop_codon:yes gene_type:complete
MHNKVKLTWGEHTVELNPPNDIDVLETLCKKVENLEDFKHLLSWAGDELSEIFGIEDFMVITDYDLKTEQAQFFAVEKEEDSSPSIYDDEDEDDEDVGDAPKMFLQVHDIEQTKDVFPKKVYDNLVSMKCKLLILAWKDVGMTELCDYFVTEIHNDLIWRFGIFEPRQGMMGYDGEHNYKEMILSLSKLGYKLVD